jgi:septum formation protein
MGFLIDVVLASGSPRRKEILEQLGVTFTTLSPQVDETTHTYAADQAVREVSARKAKAAVALLKAQGKDLNNTLIIAADTAVAYQMKQLGKPKTKKAAIKMLSRLQGDTHFVTTGVTLILGDKILTDNQLTKVHFAPVPLHQIEAYVATKEPMDKAGAYGVQGFASLFIDRMEGDYFNVVGFPVYLFQQMLGQLGLEVLPGKGIVTKPSTQPLYPLD